ncbi:putative ribonuclease H-like domain-containing protein, partial [Tanacetum coccineum]
MKKMAREAEFKKQMVFNTGNRVAKPVWTNANRVNHANHFVPRSVQLNTGRTNVNSVRPNINSGRQNVNSVKTNINTVRSKQPVPTNNTNSFSLVRPQDHPLKNMEDRGIFDSGCSGHMTGNKDHLNDFEEYKGGSVTFRRDLDQLAQKHLREVTTDKATSTNSVNSGSEPANTQPVDQDDSDMPELTIFNKPQKGIFDEEGMVHDFNNLPIEVAVSPIPTLRIYNIHLQSQILGDPKSSVQTRSRVKQTSGAHALVSYVQKKQRNNYKYQQHCLFACFLSQEEPEKIYEALQDDSWVEAMQEELLQFRLQQVWILVDLPHGAKVIGTKWVYRNKRDERGVVVRNKARLVAQGHRQEECIDYDEVFANVARIEAIKLFLAFASFIGFIVYQMDVKRAFLYSTIDEE